MIIQQNFQSISKGDSKLSKDLERLNQRIQASKISLHQSEIKVEDLDALIHATKAAREARKHKQPK